MAAKQRLKRPRTTVSDGPDACLDNKNGSMDVSSIVWTWLRKRTQSIRRHLSWTI